MLKGQIINHRDGVSMPVNLSVASNTSTETHGCIVVVKGVSGRNQHREGCYVEGYVEGVPVVFTADTGAAKTIISTSVFKRMDSQDQPKLRGSVSLVGPNGQSAKLAFSSS